MSLCLFLGAGFSSPFGHPVMDDFLGFADASQRLSDEQKAFLGRLVLEARSANSFLESSPTNLESILSFAEMGARLDLDEAAAGKADELREIIRLVYSTSGPASKYWDRFGQLERLIRTPLTECVNRLAIITTNYDVNIESSIMKLGARTKLGFESMPVSYGTPTVVGSFHANGPGPVFPLFKLHGSINWTQQGQYTLVDDRVVAVSDWSDKRGDNTQPSLPFVCCGDYKPEQSPMIVPPSFLKRTLPKQLDLVWSRAAQMLSRVNYVAFVGYSFPSSDTEMMYFLARSLSQNERVRALYVVDPKASDIVARLRSPESRLGSHFRDLLVPIQGDWTKAEVPTWR